MSPHRQLLAIVVSALTWSTTGPGHAASTSMAVSVTVVDTCRVAETIRCGATQALVTTAPPRITDETAAPGVRRRAVHF